MYNNIRIGKNKKLLQRMEKTIRNKLYACCVEVQSLYIYKQTNEIF